MKKIAITSALIFGLATSVFAQEKVWTLEECMIYAIENSPKVKQKVYEADNSDADYLASLGAFLPSINGSIGTDFNFGRSINPETNIYSNYSTMNNYYSLSTNINLFRGGRLINQWRQAKVNRSIGKTDEQFAKDDLAMTIMDAYVNVVYYKEMIQMATEKLEESNKNLYTTQRQEELGLKSVADVAQMDAQVAADAYNLTNYENLYNTNLLTLKEYMNLPFDEDLIVDSKIMEEELIPQNESVSDIFEFAKDNNPTAIKASLNLKYYQLQHKIAKGEFFPTISFSAQIYTNYYDILRAELDEDGNDPRKSIKPFDYQFKNNRSEYVGINLSIPLFNRLSTITNVRKARNNARIAAEQQTETLRQLQNTIEKNILDREGYAKEVYQLQKEVNSNQLSYQLTLRKYEEGLSSPLDVQVVSNTLINSKANLLQRQLFYVIKNKIVDYYKGIPLIEE